MKKGNRILAFLLCVMMAAAMLPAAALAASVQTITVPAETQVGDTIRFGAYEQDNNTANGAEAIEWQVLDIQDQKALIISKYALDCKPYHEKTVPVTWETCSLRAWLNDDFLRAAFTAEEQRSIITATLTNPDHPSFGTSGGNDTTDKVFLLSTDEADKYFASDADRIVYATAYAFAQGCYTCDQETLRSYSAANGDEYCSSASCWWWLRSPGFHAVYANSVHDNGQVIARSPGSDVRRGENAVRPAMWVDVELVSEPRTTLPDDTAVGDIVRFGTYEQDNNTANGAEAIEWQVLDIRNGKALVVSKYALDCQPYHQAYEHVTWETCSLRSWLNQEFLHTAFTTSEQKSIAATTVSNPDSEAYGTPGGNDTVDRIFLLSIQETLEYFPTMEERITYPTAYAFAQGCYTLDVTTTKSYWQTWGDGYCSTASCWWWQRSVGYTPVFAASCHDDGQLTLKSLGSDVRRQDTAVRPAMWINLDTPAEINMDADCALKAGAGACEIVFDDAMFPVEGFNGEVHLNPYVRVLVLEQDTKAAIVAYETVNVPSDVIVSVKEIVSAKTGVPAGNVWVHATHAITTPHAPDDSAKRELFVKSMTEAVAAAAEQAAASFQPAVMGVGVGTCQVNANRGVEIGGSWYYGLNSTMPSNKEMTIVSFASLQGDPIGFLISYGIKPTAIDNAEMAAVTRKLSSDVPGVACRMMEAEFGVPAMFCMPAAGDQIPKETAMYYEENEAGEAVLVELSVAEGIEIVERLGAEMGSDAISIAKNAAYTNDKQAIVVASTSFTWPSKSGDGEVKIDVSGITLGDQVAFVGFKPEVNAVTEQELWAASPYEHTLLMSFVDGDQKYMPDSEAHDLGTWEFQRSGTSKGSAEQFVTTAAELLEGMKSGDITENTESESSAVDNSAAAKKTVQIGGYDWIVLDEQDDRMLVLSAKVLEKRAYHAAGGAITWENCELREYLNGEFYNKTFSAEEKTNIIETVIENKSNSLYGIAGGSDTADKVFLLSLNEAEKYLGTGVELLRGIDIETGEVTWWHLRSPGEATNVNASVNAIGLIDYHGVFDGVQDPTGGIRPAMWISTKEGSASKGSSAPAEVIPAGHEIYTVAAGDSLWSIAAKFYGSGANWKMIYEANKDTIKNTSLIYAGQKLVIPAP